MESDDFDKDLLAAPEMLRELVENCKRKKFDKQYETLEPEDDSEKETSLFCHLVSKVFIFIMALILFIVALIVIMLLLKGAKMQVLVTNLAVLKVVKALTEGTKTGTNYEYWIIIARLSLILLGIMFLIIEKVHKMPIFRKYQYSNAIKILLFISNINLISQLNYTKLQVVYICLN